MINKLMISIRVMAGFLILSIIIVGVMAFTGYRLNYDTDSLKRGIYKESNEPSDYATSCLSETIVKEGVKNHYLKEGKCYTGIMPVIKKIFAKEGDLIDFDNDILTINGVRFPNYPRSKIDSNGRKLIVLFNTPIVITKDKYFLIGDNNPNSWDSRYYGPVAIEKFMKPVILFE